MAGEGEPAAPSGPDSALGRLVGAFVSPARTFAAVAAKPTFLLPLVLWTALSFLVSELVPLAHQLEGRHRRGRVPP